MVDYILFVKFHIKKYIRLIKSTVVLLSDYILLEKVKNNWHLFLVVSPKDTCCYKTLHIARKTKIPINHI